MVLAPHFTGNGYFWLMSWKSVCWLAHIQTFYDNHNDDLRFFKVLPTKNWCGPNDKGVKPANSVIVRGPV